MSHENEKTEGFNSDRFLRRLERERRLKEIEQSFENIAEEAQKKQDDIYSTVFTEKGQEHALANHSDAEGSKMFIQTKPEYNNNANSMFSRVTDMIAPAKEKRVHQHPTFEMSPTGVSSFPEIGPIGVAKKGTSAYWQKDGPGVGARMTSARVQGTILNSFFTVRANSKKFIIGFLLLLFVIVLSVTLADLRGNPVQGVHLSEEGWEKLRMIKPVLMNQSVDERKLDDRKSAHFASLVWLADEADIAQTSIADIDERTLLERFVLLVFYHSTISATKSWTSKYNWLTKGLSVCEWGEVVCTRLENENEDDGPGTKVVTTINMSKNGLVGTITDEISKLKQLQFLRLSGNKLEGKVPSSLGQLKLLETLDLGNNDLTGEVPDSLCDLRQEEVLSKLISDCGGSGADIECECCTECSP